MNCEKVYLGICFVKQSNPQTSSIFTFSEFIAALALLVIVYTVTDVRYKFRVAIAPTSFLSLYKLTYLLIGVIGFGTLLTDIWIAEKWLVPESYYLSQSIWQGAFGFFFLSLAITWIYHAFIKPPIFCEQNYQKYAQQLFRLILKGSDNELPIIADEIARSAKPLVRLCRKTPPNKRNDSSDTKEKVKVKGNVGDYAYEMLLLIGNRKLCRHVISSSPATAIAFFNAMIKNNRYDIPIGQFVKNISTEAILNKDSILHHEDDGYSSGLIGYLQPFSKAVYGDYELVEALASNHGSPLDIDYQVAWSWDASQLGAYTRATAMTFKSYIASDSRNKHSFALYRAFGTVKNSCRDVSKLNDIPDYYPSDIMDRLDGCVEFVKEVIDIISKQQDPPKTKLRVPSDLRKANIYDHIADLMFEIILSAAAVTGPPDKCHSIHHNTVWTSFLDFSGSNRKSAWGIIRFKLRRKLYDEIIRMEKFPNYKSSKILGFCLNVMGMQLGKKTGYDKAYYPLHKAVLEWTRNNYLRLHKIQPDVAKSCLIGFVSFDEDNSRLVATYFKGLRLEPPKVYLELLK